VIEEIIQFASQGLSLEGRLSYAEDLGTPVAAVLICPPHPFLGGDMDNNVIAALNADLTAVGIPVFRFNYRGIGTSECSRDLNADLEQFWQASSCPDYEAEILIDSANAFSEFSRLLPDPLPLNVIGYSFGTLAAIAVVDDPRVSRLCLISPPLAKWPLKAPTRSVDCALFYAPGDFACPTSNANRFFDSLLEPKTLRTFDDTDHFFIGREAALTAAVRDYLLKP
jgi:uncharacterized protein